jgi:hypothetical protein
MNWWNKRECSRVQRRLSAARDAQWSDFDAAIQAHLAQCPDCRRFEERLRRQGGIVHTIGHTGDTPPPGSLTARALAAFAVEQQAERERRSAFPAGLAWSGGALALSAAVIAGFYLMSGTKEQASSGGRIAAVPTATPVPTPSPAIAPTVRTGDTPVLASDTPGSRAPVVAAPGGFRFTPMPRYSPAPTVRMPDPVRVAVNPGIRPAVSRSQPVDDLKFLNRDNMAFTRAAWYFKPSEIDQLKAEMDRNIKKGDGDFVEVPFPLIASTDRRAVASAMAVYQQEKEIVDARLQKRVALGVKRTSFGDLCDQLAKETGIEIVAAKAVADDKVTIFCKDRPVRDIMRAVSSLFGFTWDRSGTEGAYRYRLNQSLRNQLLEEELRNKDRNEALLALDREMERAKNYLNMSPEEIRQLAETASPDDKKFLESLAGSGYGPAKLYHSLSPDQLNALRNGQTLRFGPTETGLPSGPASVVGAGAPGTVSLPPELSSSIMQALAPMARVNGDSIYLGQSAKGRPGLPPGEVPGAQARAQLSLYASELGQMQLMGASGFEVGSPGNVSSALLGTNLATGMSPSAKNPKNAEANNGMANKPGMGNKVSLAPTPLELTVGEEKTKRITTAELLEAIHRTTGKDVIGDYYTKLYSPADFEIKDKTLFETLCRLSDTARYRWNAEDDWLTFRNSAYFNERPKEVPNRLLERWAMARKAGGGTLSTDMLLEMAGSLSDTQLDGSAMSEGARVLYGLEEWSLVQPGNLRPGWRFVATMNPNQRKAVFGEQGIGFAQLTLPQQTLFARAALGENGMATATPEMLAGATFRVFCGPEKDLPRTGTVGPDEPTKSEKLTVRFTSRYSPDGRERTVRVLGPNSTSVSREDNQGPGGPGGPPQQKRTGAPE